MLRHPLCAAHLFPVTFHDSFVQLLVTIPTCLLLRCCSPTAFFIFTLLQLLVKTWMHKWSEGACISGLPLINYRGSRLSSKSQNASWTAEKPLRRPVDTLDCQSHRWVFLRERLRPRAQNKSSIYHENKKPSPKMSTRTLKKELQAQLYIIENRS